MINSAFDALLKMKARKMNIERIDEIASTEIEASPSNYFRNMEGPQELVSEGHEFVISKKVLTESGFGKPKRGDVLSDPELGDLMVKEVREMAGFAGVILGYRVRVG